MIPTQIDKSLKPILYRVSFPPSEDIKETKNMINLISSPEEILSDNKINLKQGIKYDINRVSSKNARKSELGPYKTSFLREIIASHGMGKINGTKNELVETILNFYDKKSN